MVRRENHSKRPEKFVSFMQYSREECFLMQTVSRQVTFNNVFRPMRLDSLAGVQITSVSCGSKHTCAMDSEGMLWTWGFGGYGSVPFYFAIFRTRRLPASANHMIPGGLVALFLMQCID